MLGFLFGFDARLGRLHYFLASVGLAIVTTGLCFAIATAIYRNTPRGMPLSFEQMAWPVMAVAAIFMLCSFSLQCMRIRDIGWDPVCVVPTWIAIVIIDNLVATKFPAWSLGPEHYGTAVGALINFGLCLALTFWPGADTVGAPPRFEPPPRQPEAPSRRGGETLAASRIARVTSGEFGRRGS
jgi:uncharacterized membrane protein YhaH (DUF805 family)